MTCRGKDPLSYSVNTHQASYTKMTEATAEDIRLTFEYIRRDQHNNLADRLLKILGSLDQYTPGVPVTRYEHLLQSATRAYRGREA